MKPGVIIAIVLGVLFIVIGIMYFTQTAGNLPSFFPGYQMNAHFHHMKHGIAAIVVGIACLVFAWFQSGSKVTSS